MKQLICIVLIMSVTNVFAQREVDFGVKGGVNLTFFNVSQAGFGLNNQSELGYYGGLFADVMVSEEFSIQPELLYIGIKDFNFINVPIYAKYEVAENLALLAGPSLNYFFDFFSNKFKVRADISSAYQVSSKLDVHMKYTLGFEELSPNSLFFGLGYRL